MKFGQHAERPGLSDAFERLHNERLHRDEGVSFRVGVAATDWQFTQAHALVSRQYRRAGYLEPQAPSSSSASPLVALALRNTLGGGGESQALGTVALRCDGPSGLLADEQYRSTLDVMRAQGSRLAECGRLAVDAAAPFITVLGQLVRTVAHIAREERNVTDVVALCHPRHAHFYCRTLGFARLGELSFCQYVGGAPALLLHLPIEHLVELAGRHASARIYKLRQTVIPKQHCSEQTETGDYAYSA